jgi:hypothetical protein
LGDPADDPAVIDPGDPALPFPPATTNYGSTRQLFNDAYQRGRRLKTLRGLAPLKYVARIWTEDPAHSKSIRAATRRD